MRFAKQGCHRRAAHHSVRGMSFGGFSCCMYQVSLRGKPLRTMKEQRVSLPYDSDRRCVVDGNRPGLL